MPGGLPGVTRTTLEKPENPYEVEYSSIKGQHGDWMHIAETSHSFNFENAKAVDHGRFKRDRLVKEALHLELQAFNRPAHDTMLSNPDNSQSQGRTI